MRLSSRGLWGIEESAGRAGEQFGARRALPRCLSAPLRSVGVQSLAVSYHPGECVDVLTLILCGAAGGLARGALDLYTRFMSWTADRHAHQLAARSGTAQGQAVRFTAYFDVPVDIAAAAVHAVMGAGAAALFGSTGEISGKYAAIVVGMSAPVLLTQLLRIQTVNEALTGERQPAGTSEPAAQAVAPAVTTPTPEAQGLTRDPEPGVPGRPSPPAPGVAGGTTPVPPHIRSPLPRPRPSLRPGHSVTDARTPDPAAQGGQIAGRPPSPDPARLEEAPSSVDPAARRQPGPEGRDAPRWQRTDLGEEGL